MYDILLRHTRERIEVIGISFLASPRQPSLSSSIASFKFDVPHHTSIVFHPLFYFTFAFLSLAFSLLKLLSLNRTFSTWLKWWSYMMLWGCEATLQAQMIAWRLDEWKGGWPWWKKALINPSRGFTILMCIISDKKSSRNNYWTFWQRKLRNGSGVVHEYHSIH